MNSSYSIQARARRASFLSAALAAVVGVCGAVGTTAVHAQATAGDVFGKAPAGASIQAKSTTTGTQRVVEVDAKGRYAIRSLPAGVYNVILTENGQPVAKHVNVPVVVGRGIQVNFDGQAAGTGQQ